MIETTFSMHMPFRTQKFRLTLTALALAGLAWAQTNPSTTSAVAVMAELFGDQVIARGKSFEIKRSQLDAALLSFKALLAARGQTLPPAANLQVERELLQQLIRIQMLVGRATEEDRAEGTRVGEKRFEQVLERAGSMDNLTRQLKSVGITPDQLKARLIEEATAEAVIRREVQVNVTDEEVRKFYDENPAQFEEPERVRVSHILLRTLDANTREPLSEELRQAKRKQMDEILQKVKAGEDFSALARKYSEDAGSKDRGGEYIFARGQMVPEFETAAFSLQPGQISDIVTTQFGYHIVKMHERMPARRVPFDEVKERIRDYLITQAIQKVLPDYVRKIRADENVEVLVEDLKEVEQADLPSAMKEP
ncbi:MAG: peptidylprolyl isomerase [Verrucomicrobiota bacterium]|nr:peptidylprolyl isomerase [Limisphaera sp.]MDW8380745.1 peptidylprolyl isomerase [Verrucomicrobiota bacterium]